MRQQQGMAPARLKLKTLNDNPYLHLPFLDIAGMLDRILITLHEILVNSLAQSRNPDLLHDSSAIMIRI